MNTILANVCFVPYSHFTTEDDGLLVSSASQLGEKWHDVDPAFQAAASGPV